MALGNVRIDSSIIGFSIVNVKRALLQRLCGIYISRYRYRTCWVIYLTKGRNLIKGAILSGHQIYLEISGQRCVKGALLERYSWI